MAAFVGAGSGSVMSWYASRIFSSSSAIVCPWLMTPTFSFSRPTYHPSSCQYSSVNLCMARLWLRDRPTASGRGLNRRAVRRTLSISCKGAPILSARFCQVQAPALRALGSPPVGWAWRRRPKHSPPEPLLPHSLKEEGERLRIRDHVPVDNIDGEASGCHEAKTGAARLRKPCCLFCGCSITSDRSLPEKSCCRPACGYGSPRQSTTGP